MILNIDSGARFHRNFMKSMTLLKSLRTYPVIPGLSLGLIRTVLLGIAFFISSFIIVVNMSVKLSIFSEIGIRTF